MSSSSESGAVGGLAILYDHADGIYHPGERLTGKLEILLKQPMVLNAIKLQFKGRAVWLGEGKKAGEVEKVYFNRDIVLLDRLPGRDPGAFQWEPGTHVLPFECPLPRSCATSYEGPQAFVRYFCRATLVRSKGEGVKTRDQLFATKAPFTLLAHPPPSVDPTLWKGVGASESVSINGICCLRGKMQGDVSLPKSCFVAGEKIFGSIKVENKHPRAPIEGLFCRLVEVLKKSPPSSANDARPINRILVERRLEDSLIRTKDHLSRDNIFLIQIPAISPSTREKDVHVFSLGYELELYCGPKLSLLLPIVIGSVPLSLDDGAPVATGFKEFVLGPQDIRDADDPSEMLGGHKYAPKYPVFESGTYVPTPVIENQTGNFFQNNTTPDSSAIVNNGTNAAVESMSAMTENGPHEVRTVAQHSTKDSQNGTVTETRTETRTLTLNESDGATLVGTVRETITVTTNQQDADTSAHVISQELDIGPLTPDAVAVNGPSSPAAASLGSGSAPGSRNSRPASGVDVDEVDIIQHRQDFEVQELTDGHSSPHRQTDSEHVVSTNTEV